MRNPELSWSPWLTLVAHCGLQWDRVPESIAQANVSRCVCRAEGVVDWWTSGLVGCLEVPALDQAS